jgi:hypothetical protein
MLTLKAFRNLARRLALGDALPRFLGLVGREDRLAPHLDTLGAGDLPPFVCALDDAKPFILRHGGHHRHEGQKALRQNSCRPCEKSGVRLFAMCVSRALMDSCYRGLDRVPDVA